MLFVAQRTTSNQRNYTFISEHGFPVFDTGKNKFDANNALTSHQLKRILALNQLLNIAEYYNTINSNKNGEYFHIVFHPSTNYTIYRYKEYFSMYGLVPFFNRKEDAQAVINNPNFREILDTIYKN